MFQQEYVIRACRAECTYRYLCTYRYIPQVLQCHMIIAHSLDKTKNHHKYGLVYKRTQDLPMKHTCRK